MSELGAALELSDCFRTSEANPVIRSKHAIIGHRGQGRGGHESTPGLLAGCCFRSRSVLLFRSSEESDCYLDAAERPTPDAGGCPKREPPVRGSCRSDPVQVSDGILR